MNFVLGSELCFRENDNFYHLELGFGILVLVSQSQIRYVGTHEEYNAIPVQLHVKKILSNAQCDRRKR